jgi:hypothetical protein
MDRLRREHSSGQSPEELSAASGRTFQPLTRSAGRAIELAAFPFRHLQRAKPHSGTGLVLVATKD